MNNSARPPRFKPFSAPRAIALKTKQDKGEFRGSPRERGYDAKWDRLSIAFRKRHPFCKFCEQNGRDSHAELVDHIIPASDREDLRFEWSNLQSLCRFHHGRKASWEIYARSRGLLDQLPLWCSDPKSRPVEFQPAKPK